MAARSLLSGAKEAVSIDSVCAAVVKGSFSNLSAASHVAGQFTASVVSQVLRRLSGDPSLSWSFFTWSRSLPHSDHSLHPQWTMLHSLAKNKCFMAAQQLLETSSLMDSLSSPSVLTSLVSSSHQDPEECSQILSLLVVLFSRSKPPAVALQVFDEMKKARFAPDEHACSALLSTLAKSRLTATAWKVFGEMLDLRVSPNVHVYNALLHVCYKSGDAVKAEHTVGEMRRKGLKPDLFSYNTLIALYSKKGMHYEVLGVQETMKRESIRPDIVTYNSIIYGFCREGRMSEAWRFFEGIGDGAAPNIVTYTTLIDGYCRANDVEKALRIREVMERRGLFPGVITYNSIIRKLCEEGKMKAVNELLVEMDDRRIEPDNFTCNTMINAYCKKGDMSSAWKLRNKMLESGLSLDHFTYKALIHGYCKVQEMDEAKDVLFGMIDAGFAPNYSTFAWIVDGYCDQNNEAEALRIPDELDRRGGCDASVYKSLVRRFCKRGLVDCAYRVFLHMQGKGMPGDSIVLLNLAYGYFCEGKPIAASEMLDLMVKQQLRITARIYNSIRASYADKFVTLDMMWSNAIDKGLVHRNVCKMIQKQN